MRYNKTRSNLKLRGLLPPLRGPPASRRKAFARCASAYSGYGFCPMVRGRPRAMLAPDASVGKAEIQLEVELAQ